MFTRELTKLAQIETDAKAQGKGKWGKSPNSNVRNSNVFWFSFIYLAVLFFRLFETSLGQLIICANLLIRIMANSLMVRILILNRCYKDNKSNCNDTLYYIKSV